jgi:hypothetical protein
MWREWARQQSAFLSVIHAKAGIQSDIAFVSLDPRLRGVTTRWFWPPAPRRRTRRDELLSQRNRARVSAGKERLMPGIYALAVFVFAFFALASPARADDFPSDVKRTFTTDIPHFFQDDIPCAFGGKPTSGAKSSCKGPSQPATSHKATTHKKKRVAAKHAAKPAAGKTPPDQASSGANAGAAAGTPAAASPGAR